MLHQISDFIKKISLTEKLLYLYIILIPVMRVPYLPFVGQKIQYSDIVFLLLFFIWLVQLIKGGRSFLNLPLKFSLGGMLIVFLFSFVHTEHLARSGLEYAGILYLVSLYVVLCQTVDSQAVWWRLIKCWCLVSLLIALTGIGAYFISVISGHPNFLVVDHEFLGNANQELVLRLASIFRHPAMLTMYLHTTIVFGFVLAARKNNGKWCFWGYSIVVLCFIAALLTKTRCNAGIAFTIFCGLAFMPKENIYILILRYASFIYALVLMIAVVFLTVWWIFPVHVQRNLERQTVTIELNSAHQPYFMQHMIETKIIRDFPWVGVGMGMSNDKAIDYIHYRDIEKPFRMLYPDLREDQVSRYKTSIDPHSMYLGIAAETGLLGLTALLFFLFRTVCFFCKAIKQEINIENRYINQIILAGLGGFLFNALYVDMLTVRSFWFLIAMGVIYISISRHKETGLEERG